MSAASGQLAAFVCKILFFLTSFECYSSIYCHPPSLQTGVLKLACFKEEMVINAFSQNLFGSFGWKGPWRFSPSLLFAKDILAVQLHSTQVFFFFFSDFSL